jgi:hypothetical protein
MYCSTTRVIAWKVRRLVQKKVLMAPSSQAGINLSREFITVVHQSYLFEPVQEYGGGYSSGLSTQLRRKQRKYKIIPSPTWRMRGVDMLFGISQSQSSELWLSVLSGALFSEEFCYLQLVFRNYSFNFNVNYHKVFSQCGLGVT